MSITYPTTLDSLPNPTNTDLLENATLALDHDQQHANANDAIEALEAKVGVNGSAVTTSHDYKLSGVTGSDKAVSKTGTETLTNKTLTAPQINFGSDANGDIIIRNGSGVTTRLAIGTTDQILAVQSGLPAWIANPSATTATYSTAGISTIDADVRYYAADAGANDTYVITLSPAPTAYTTGMKISFKANTINTGAATLNVNSLGAKTIVKGVNTTLADGDIAAGMFCTVIYDGTNFVLQNPVVPAISITDLSNYAANTLETNVTWNTFQVPMYYSSAGVVPGWHISGMASSLTSGGYGGAGGLLELNSGGAAYMSAFLPGTSSTTRYDFSGSKDVRIKFRWKAGASNILGVGFADTTDIYASNSANGNSARFIFSSGTLYAVTGTGAANTNTDISSGITSTNWNVFEIVCNTGTDVKFYVNGTLKATHSTNLPTGVIPLSIGYSAATTTYITPIIVSIEN